MDVFVLVHFYGFEFASVGLMLVLFTRTKGTGVLKNYVIVTCVNKSSLKRHHLLTTVLLFIYIHTYTVHIYA